MNAVNPATSAAPSASGDQRPYEPSMEEILASIRRIIADDQMLPGREVPLVRREVDGPEEAQAPAHVATPEPSASSLRMPAEAAAPTVPAKLPDARSMVMSPLGQVSAPQKFPTPDTPVLAPSEISTRAPFEVDPTAFEPMAEVASSSIAVPADIAETQVQSPKAQPEETPLRQDDFVSTAPTMHEPKPEEPEDDADGVDPYFDPPIERDEPLPAAEPPANLFSSHTKQSVSTAFNVLAATRLADNSEELLGLAREMIRPLLKTWLDDNLPSMVERMVRAEIERVARGGR